MKVQLAITSLRTERGATYFGTAIILSLFSVGFVAIQDNFEQTMLASTEARFANNTYEYQPIEFAPNDSCSDTPSSTGACRVLPGPGDTNIYSCPCMASTY